MSTHVPVVTDEGCEVAGFRAVSPSGDTGLDEGEPLVVVDASVSSSVVERLAENDGFGEVVLWWRPEGDQQISIDQILRYGLRVVEDLEVLRPEVVPAGQTFVVERRAAEGPSAEFVTLLGTPASRDTLAGLTRAVAAMRRETPLPCWDRAAPSREQKGNASPLNFSDLTRKATWDRGAPSGLPALGSLLLKANEKWAENCGPYLDTLAATYRVPPSVLIVGETGTGKTALAERLHEALYPHDHKNRPFVEISAPTLRGDLFNDQFYGHLDAYSETGQVIGPALEATFGTLFIDELGDLDEPSQKGLLTFLLRRRARLHGAKSDWFLPLQIVAATNRPLERMVAAGLFRQDLYNRFPYRITLPRLRDRIGDDAERRRLVVELLSDEEWNPTVERGPRKGEPSVVAVHSDTIDRLGNFGYRTGNFRELIDLLRAGVATARERQTDVLLPGHVPEPIDVLEVPLGEPIEIRATLPELRTRLGFPEESEIEVGELGRLSQSLGDPILRTADDELVIVAEGRMWRETTGNAQ